jgi:hypothetical protein
MIIFDRGSQFVARFWEQLHASLGTHLIHRSAYHSQTDGQTERVTQILEDMLRACVMEYPGSWDKNLSWAEFSYNNNYQESLKMAPFEALYGRQCHTPLNWIEPGEKAIVGPDIVVEAEATTRRMQENLKITKLRQESYATKRRRPLQFEAGDHMYLKVSPMKGMKRFWSDRKAITSLYWTIPNSGEVWEGGMQVRVTTVTGRSSQHLRRISAREVFEGTHRCCIAGSGAARHGFDISRTSDQDLGPKESCHKAQDDKVLQDPMEQPYGRRSNMGE